MITTTTTIMNSNIRISITITRQRERTEAKRLHSTTDDAALFGINLMQPRQQGRTGSKLA